MGIEIVSQYKVNPKDYGYNGNCIVTYIHVKIADIKKRAQIIKNDFLDMSWINKLDVATKIAYEKRANDTISKLIKNVLDKVEDTVTEEFGEILVSTSAKDTLCTHYNHKKISLAELWKETQVIPDLIFTQKHQLNLLPLEKLNIEINPTLIAKLLNSLTIL